MRLLLALFISAQLYAAVDLNPLLLTPKRLKRLKLDRERQTDRWVAFERRVQTNTDSPEHAVEIAVYSAVMSDTQKAHQAVAMLLANPCNALAKGIVDSATSDVQTPDESSRIQALVCADADHPLSRFDINVPADAFLLSLRPEQVEHPSWQHHVAALLLVNLDPNSQPAQFLQGWAMEDRFTLAEGPGVVYEFLYADPYLPGVSYQNMQPWQHSPGSLRARSDWTPQACWIHWSAKSREQENCPANVWTRQSAWGDLTVLPADARCMDIPASQSLMLLSNLPPGAKLTYTRSDSKLKVEADDAGFWQVPPGSSGKLCVNR